MKLTTKEFTIRDLVSNGVIAIDDDNIKRHYDGSNLGRVIDEKDAKYDNLGGDADGLGLILKDGTICVRPPYQRGEAWDTKQQISLIKSVYEGYPITSIFFADVKDETLCSFIQWDSFNWCEIIFITTPIKGNFMCEHPVIISSIYLELVFLNHFFQ